MGDFYFENILKKNYQRGRINMKKNKLKLLLSIIICFSLINIGGVFSYAGGSSGGGGFGFASEPARPLIVKKVWQPDKTGNYGPDKDKPVIINADLSFQVKHEGQVLNFKISRHNATQRIENYLRMPGQSNQLASIDFFTGMRIEEVQSSMYYSAPVITLKDIDGKGYTAQFYTRDLMVNEKTQETIIREILVYKTPKTPIKPPMPPIAMHFEEERYKNIEQPDPNATKYSEVKAKLSITEIGNYNNYDKKVEIRALPYSPAEPIKMREVPPPPHPEGYALFNSLDITVTNTYNPPVPEEEKPPVPPEENTPPKEKTKKPSVPNTGDSEAFMVLISLLAIGTAGAVMVVKRKNS